MDLETLKKYIDKAVPAVKGMVALAAEIQEQEGTAQADALELAGRIVSSAIDTIDHEASQ